VNARDARYRPLPGRSFGPTGRSRLWLAEDHLLEVNGILFAERYRRFPLADIRAIVVEPTRGRTRWLAISGGIALLCILAILGIWWIVTLNEKREVIVGLWVVAGAIGVLALGALLVFLVALARGATCRCLVQTTAGLRVLAAPTRRRMAAVVVPILTAEIEAAQAGIRP
jgi:hypothetical protein